MADLITGVDEAGRGPLAGPVVAAAVILCEEAIGGLDDSKKLTRSRRQALEVEIKSRCRWAVGTADVDEIDRINILEASLLAMARAVRALDCDPGEILVDGNRLPAWSYRSRAVVGGDRLHPCISAASIIAKEHRDRIMMAAAAEYPVFGWERNMGYGTAEHLEALRLHGPTPLHRRSFAPVAQRRLL